MQINELCKRKALEQYFSCNVYHTQVNELWDRVMTGTLTDEDIIWIPFQDCIEQELAQYIENTANDFQQIWNAGYTEGWDKSATFYLNTSNE